MSRKMPIFYSALMLTGVNLLLRLVSTSFQVYLSGQIGAAGIGLLQLVLSVGMLATTAGMAGVRTATMYLTAEELGKKRPENVSWVLSGCFLYSILCSTFFSLGLYFLAPVVAERWIGDGGTVAAIRLYAGFLPVTCLCGCMTGYFTAANRIGTLAAVEVAEQLCSMAATLGLLHFWAAGDAVKACSSVILGSGLGGCMTLVCLYLLYLSKRSPAGPRIPVARRLLDTALPLALGDDLKAGISAGENLMVPKRLALYGGISSPLAAFGTVCGMVFPVMMFPAAILFGLAELLIPELARCNAAGFRRRIQYLAAKSLRTAMLYGFLCSGILFLTAEELCMALYGNPQAGKYLRLYSLLIPMLYCDCITDAMTKGLGQQKACVRYNILTSGMDVVLLFLLLPRYGMVGYFWSFLVTHLLNFILSIRRLFKISGTVVSPPAVILTVTAAIAAVWGASFLSAPALRACAFILLFGSLLVLVKVLRKEDLQWLRRLICT